MFAVAFHTIDSKGVNDETEWSGIAGDLSPVIFSNFDNNANTSNSNSKSINELASKKLEAVF